MKYLVLRRFWSYGKLLEKGSVVDESEIRSPNLRRSEGKITPAVSSLEVPEEFGAEDTGSQVLLGDDDIPPAGSAEGAEDGAGSAGENTGDETGGENKENAGDEAGEPEQPKTLFNLFGKKD